MCIFKPKISFSTGLRGKKTFRTVEEAFLFKKQPKPNKNPSHPLHIQLICAQLFKPLKRVQSQGHAYSQVPSHSLAPNQECTNSFVCCLHPRVWALGGCKATWGTPATLLFHVLHSLSYSQRIFSLPDLPNLLSKPSQTNTFPSNFCKILFQYQLLLIFQEHSESSWKAGAFSHQPSHISEH